MKPDAIFTADIHIMERQPRCRTDNYFEAQQRKFRFLKKIQKKYNCPIIDAGDFTDEAILSPFLEGWIIKNSPEDFRTIFGNHDTPFRNDELLEKASLHVLELSGAVQILEGNEVDVKGRKIKIVHELISDDSKLKNSTSALTILNKYKEYDCILTGDNHNAFVIRHKKILLVNPGSMMRMRADQVNFKPRCYAYFAETNTVKPLYYPIEPDVLNREYIDKKKEIDEKMDSFIEGISDNYELSLDYKRNVMANLKNNDYGKEVKEAVLELLEVE